MFDISNAAKQLGSRGGQKSVESRFKNKTKEEKSEMMRRVRVLKKHSDTIRKILYEEQKSTY